MINCAFQYSSIIAIASLLRIAVSANNVRENGGNCFGVKSCRPRCITYKVHRENVDCGAITGGFLNDGVWKHDKFKAINCDKGGSKNKCTNEKCGEPLPANLTIRIGEEFVLADEDDDHRYFYTIVDLPEGEDIFTFCSLYYCDGHECALPEQMGYEIQMELRDMAQPYSREEAPRNNKFEDETVSLVLESFFQPNPETLMSLKERTVFGPLEVLWFDDPAGCDLNNTSVPQNPVPISPPSDPLILTLDEAPRYGLSSPPSSANYCTGENYELSPLPISAFPSASPSESSSPSTSMQPSASPTVSHAPSISLEPTSKRTLNPSSLPSVAPSLSLNPSSKPSPVPSEPPSSFPTTNPTMPPSSSPTITALPTMSPSSTPSVSNEPTEVAVITDTIRTSLTLSPVPGAMDSPTIATYERVASDFIQKTRPSKGLVYVTTAVKVLNQAVRQDRSSSLNERNLQEADLEILMDINGTIEEPDDEYTFEDDVLFGFRNNFSLFLDDLAAASDFFSGLDRSIPASLVDEENNSKQGSVFRAHDWVLIIVFSCAFVVVTLLLINQYAANRKELEQDSSAHSRSSGSRSPCLGIAPRDWTVEVLDEEDPFVNQQRSGKVEVMLTPRNNNDAEVSDGSSMTDSTNVNVDEQQKLADQSSSDATALSVTDDSKFVKNQHFDNEELLMRSVVTLRKGTPSSRTNFADPEGIRILHDLESIVVDSPAGTPTDGNFVPSPRAKIWKRPSIVCANLSVDTSGSEYSVDDSEFHDCDESQGDKGESDVPFDEKKDSKWKVKSNNTRLMMEKGARHFTFDNICTPSNCVDESPSTFTVTPTMGNRSQVNGEFVDERCAGEPNDLHLIEEPQPKIKTTVSPSVKDIARKFEHGIASTTTTPPTLPVVSPDQVRSSPKNYKYCGVDFEVSDMKPYGDESTHHLLHENHRKSDE
uniref:ZP domain-containing protein n=1 Tax=Leptocylindrus danicus TaxID=163516 RepID=A0A7S2NT06_9STRA|mmetsp:Transcript_11567/g.17493  ORF Transcript_11567/g.17493 Transcript_11567/m.17493 type:complete len:935 (+) Transcript_11567:27-2831(+)